MKTHTGEKLYSCEVCGSSFSLKGNLPTHMLLNTGKKPYSCDICWSSFSQKSYLKRHMKRHTGEKLYLYHPFQRTLR